MNLSGEGCIVYPLYEGISGIYPEHHINSACWSAHSFLVNSDVIEQKIPVFFYVEDTIWSRAYKQLMSSCIPNPMVLHYRAPNRIGWNGQWLSQSLCVVNNDRFKDYENVVVPDTDLFLSTRHENEKLDISRLWNRIDRTKYASYDIRPDRMREPKWDKYYEKSTEEGKLLFRKLMQQRLKRDIMEVHHILAVINSFSPKELNPKFKEFVNDVVQYIGSEEDMLSVYMQWSGEDIEDIGFAWDLWVANYLHVFNDYYDNYDFFFSHLRPSKLPTEADTERFMQAIGRYKEVSDG